MARVQVLDHGYIELVEAWGSDERIVEAARMSTGKGFQGWGRRCPDGVIADGPLTHEGCETCKGKGEIVGDEKLLAYLWEHKHATPFEMGGLVIESQAPISVYREWQRHRTQSYNEMSARYVPLPDMNYVPTIERLLINSKTNKQAGTIKGAAELDEVSAQHYLENLIAMYQAQESLYQQALAAGVPKELARMHLPVGRYSRMRASANLRNWLAFLTLRMDPAAQWEIRQYANEVGKIVAERFPRTWELFASSRSS
jgi:thymidylate synthase (FAD)